MSYRVPLAYNTFAEAEFSALKRVIETGFLTQGVEIDAFEKAFAAYHGAKHAIVVNSGSSANLIAIEAIIYGAQMLPHLAFGRAFEPGAEVIMPGLSWPTTVKPLLNHNLQPVFCDVELSTLNITPQTLEAVRTPRTRAVVAVPILGNPGGLDAVREYCAAQELVLIEDACESLGARSESGRRVGTFGLASAFSFYFSHHISTIEGGAILTDSDEVADLCYSLRSHGWTRHLKLGAISVDDSSQDIDPRFCFFLPGYNVRATEITGALGQVQLGRLEEFLTARRRIAAGRIDALRSVSNAVVVPGADIQARHSWMTFPLMFPDRERRNVGQVTFEKMGVETRPIIVGNILRHPMVRAFNLKPDQPQLPRCDEVFARGMMLGLNPGSDDEAEAVVHEALRTVASD